MKPEEDRFPSIYERYMPLLRSIAGSRGIPYDEIDDVVQEAFFAYYRHYPLNWEEDRIRGYLTRIVRNLCADYIRKKSRRVPDWERRTRLPEWLPEAADRQDPLQIVLERQEYQMAAGAFWSMKRDWLRVIVLYAVEERPIGEISETLGISEAACRMRLSRGRRYLKRKLGRWLETDRQRSGRRQVGRKKRK